MRNGMKLLLFCIYKTNDIICVIQHDLRMFQRTFCTSAVASNLTFYTKEFTWSVAFAECPLFIYLFTFFMTI